MPFYKPAHNNIYIIALIVSLGMTLITDLEYRRYAYLRKKKAK